MSDDEEDLIRGFEEYDLNIVRAWNDFVLYSDRHGDINWRLLFGYADNIDEYQEMIDSERANAEGILNGRHAPIGFFLNVDEQTLEIVASPIPEFSRGVPFWVLRRIEFRGTAPQMVWHLNCMFPSYTQNRG